MITTFIKNLIQHKAFQNFVIMGTVAFAQMINYFILGNNLSKEEMGLYTFIFSNVVLFLSIFLLFGQGSSIIRFFSSRNISDYKWKNYLGYLLALIVVLMLIAAYLVIPIAYKAKYTITIFESSYIFFGSICLAISIITASFYRAASLFNTAVLIERSHPLFFLLLLCIPMFILKRYNVDLIASLKNISLIIPALFLLFIIFKWKNGTKKIKKSMYVDGARLWELDVAIMVMQYFDGLIIPYFIDMKTVGLHTILLAIMQLYNFSFLSMFNVYSQKFSKSKDIKYLKIFITLCAISLLLGVFYMFSTNALLEVLFKGKYIASTLLVLLYCILLSLNLLYVIPSCYMIGHSNKTDMRLMFWINISSLGIKLVAIYLLKEYKLPGFLLAGIIAFGFRTIAGYTVMFRYKIKKMFIKTGQTS